MKLLEPSGIRADLGSFWYENITEESQNKLRSILDAIVSSTAYTSILHQLHRIVDDESPVSYENITVVANWTETDFDSETWYRAGLTTDSQPLVIVQGGNEYLAGIDFAVDPITRDIVFPTRPNFDSFVIKYGISDNAGPMFHTVLFSLFMKSQMGQAELISGFLRGNQDPESFENAMRAIIGLKRVEIGGVILDRKDLDNGETVYVFQDELIKVPYSHIKFPVGSKLLPGVWIGAELCSMSIYDTSTDWYRDRHDWTVYGLDLKPIVGYDLTATDTDETMVAGSPDKFTLQEDTPGDLNKFWARVLANESAFGGGLEQKYAPSSTVNPIDVFFQDFLDHAIILKLDARVLTPQAVYGLRNWFVRNCPFGYIPIVRVNTAGAEMNFSDYNPAPSGVIDTNAFYDSYGLLVYNSGFLAYNGYPLATEVDLGEYPASSYADAVLGLDSGLLLLDDEYLIFI